MQQLHDERGAVAVIVVLSMAALLGMLVLTVDLGGMLTMRRRMVASADAGALAAAQSCAKQLPSEARTQADTLAVDNEAAAANVAYTAQGCTSMEPSGTVRVTYRAPIQLQFAPVLGFPPETTVKATATAEWGPAGDVGALPIVISIDGARRIPCVWKSAGSACNYWYDNNDSTFGNAGNWGFLNLGEWDVGRGDNCPNTGTSQRRDWIVNIGVPDLPIGDSGVSYVCADTGHSTSSWYSALQSLIGQTKFFPVNDPQKMVTSPNGRQKYAIIGFTALRIEAVLRGDDPSAVGPGSPCGPRKSDPNGVCLVASWQGAQIGGTRPGGGQDFGVRAIRLSD